MPKFQIFKSGRSGYGVQQIMIQDGRMSKVIVKGGFKTRKEAQQWIRQQR